ncbi:unnamed protein product [Adineta steineri]|uniref:Alpha 1,4-glycosyltransferase domain-containing protein n=1 Tax=Adineta steineri TaxID=433720 RepID=A0A819XIC0_9BILA|nr:unnamed protein product [Adineta steineri]
MDIDLGFTRTPFEHLIPSNRFDLFWLIWTTDESTLRALNFLVIDSLFIHHPQATVIMLSSTLNDTKFFLPYRRRGYQIYAFNISLERMIQFNCDYMRLVLLFRYGGTYMDMDAIILQPLPKHEFIGLVPTKPMEKCLLCEKNKTDFHTQNGFMRFLPNRAVFLDILEDTFDRQVYKEYCYPCAGPLAVNKHIQQHINTNDSELIDLKLLETHRLFPFTWRESEPLFRNVQKDTSLQLDDIMKRSYSLHFFGHMSKKHIIAPGSLTDFLFDKLNLGNIQPEILKQDQLNKIVRLIHLPLYIYTSRKKGYFLGRNVIYVRLNQSLIDKNIKWTITIRVSNGSIIYSNTTSRSNLSQAQLNSILKKISYIPYRSTAIDTLTIYLTSNILSINSSLTILVFSKWVTFISRTMKIPDQWSSVQRLVASVETYFPQTTIHIASDLGQPICKNILLNITSSNNSRDCNLNKTLFIHNIPKDRELSKCRNYLLNLISTPFFFLMDVDLTLEEDSHLDLLLELIYTYDHIDIIAGKIPEDIEIFYDFSGVFLRYDKTLELRHNISNKRKGQTLFIRSSNNINLDKKNPCKQVDFVPLMFMGRKESVISVGWNNYFKLGEYEDFFVRFGQANRTVYTCRYIYVHHTPDSWQNKESSTYFLQEKRANYYFKNMLIKYNF